jgi:hypothetical protein
MELRKRWAFRPGVANPNRPHLGKFPKILTFWAAFWPKLSKKHQKYRKTTEFQSKIGPQNFRGFATFDLDQEFILK